MKTCWAPELLELSIENGDSGPVSSIVISKASCLIFCNSLTIPRFSNWDTRHDAWTSQKINHIKKWEYLQKNVLGQDKQLVMLHQTNTADTGNSLSSVLGDTCQATGEAVHSQPVAAPPPPTQCLVPRCGGPAPPSMPGKQFPGICIVHGVTASQLSKLISKLLFRQLLCY